MASNRANKRDVLKTCVECKTSFISTHSAKLCGDECRRNHKNKKLRAWHSDNPGKAKRYIGKHKTALKEAVFAAYGNQCACCGLNDVRFLTLDHVNNDGHLELDSSGTRRIKGTSLYKRAKDEQFPTRFQLLCWNCNCAKGVYGICPHKKK